MKDTFIGKAARKSANVELAMLKGDYQYYEDICVADQTGTLVSASSQSLAEGASEQAASIEETSSSMEEMRGHLWPLPARKVLSRSEKKRDQQLTDPLVNNKS